MSSTHDYATRKPFCVSRKHAAELLDVSVDTIDRMIQRGHLKRVQLSSRKPGIIYSSLEALIGEAR